MQEIHKYQTYFELFMIVIIAYLGSLETNGYCHFDVIELR